MSTTYSTSLKLALIGDGEQSGIWGQTTNNNLGTLLEEAITGVASIVMADANYTLTNYNGVSDEARNAVLVVTGANTAIRNVIPPVVKKLYTVVNNTSGGYDIRIIGATGTGVLVPNGYTVLVYCDGVNFYSALSTGASSLVTSNYLIQQSGSNLVTQYNGATVAVLSSTGTFTAVDANATTFNGTTGNITTVNATTANATTFNGTTGNITTVNATTANATTVVIGGFNITVSGGALTFKYGSTPIASLDSSGNFATIGNVTAYVV